MHFDITIPHRLGRKDAEARLVSYALSSPGMDTHLKIVADDWSEASGVLNCHLTAYNSSMKVRAVVSDTALQIDADDVPWTLWLYANYWKTAWKNKLTDILK